MIQELVKIQGDKWKKHCSLSLTHKLILEKIESNKNDGWYLVFEDDVDLTSEINPKRFFERS